MTWLDRFPEDNPLWFVFMCSRGTSAGTTSRYSLGDIIAVWLESEWPGAESVRMKEAFWHQAKQMRPSEIDALYSQDAEGNLLFQKAAYEITLIGLDLNTLSILSKREEYDNTSITARPGKLREVKGTIIPKVVTRSR